VARDGRFAQPPLAGARPWSLRSAFSALLQHQRAEQQPLGKLLGEAVASSITKLINIGGFIILFAVIIRLLTDAGAISHIAAAMGTILVPLGFAPDILTALASGFFEMTIGNKMASEATASELQQLIAVGMILGWSGLSIHAQVASMIAQTDMRMNLFIITRITHAMLAACLTWLFYKPVRTTLTPVTAPVFTWSSYNAWTFSLYCLLAMVIILVSLIHLAVIYRLITLLFTRRDRRTKFYIQQSLLILCIKVSYSLGTPFSSYLFSWT
jgi:nucleoside recognition membrane protein YjiH